MTELQKARAHYETLPPHVKDRATAKHLLAVIQISERSETKTTMNITLLASEIVGRIRNSMRDSAINQEIMVARMIQEAMDSERMPMRATNLVRPHTAHPQMATSPEPTFQQRAEAQYCESRRRAEDQ